MVSQAVRAWQLIRAIKAQDVELLHGLPDWAISATISQQCFMTDEDGGLWVSYPIDPDHMEVNILGMPDGVTAEVAEVAFHAHPKDILIYRGGGVITVLTERMYFHG